MAKERFIVLVEGSVVYEGTENACNKRALKESQNGEENHVKVVNKEEYEKELPTQEEIDVLVAEHQAELHAEAMHKESMLAQQQATTYMEDGILYTDLSRPIVLTVKGKCWQVDAMGDIEMAEIGAIIRGEIYELPVQKIPFTILEEEEEEEEEEVYMVVFEDGSKMVSIYTNGITLCRAELEDGATIYMALDTSCMLEEEEYEVVIDPQPNIQQVIMAHFAFLTNHDVDSFVAKMEALNAANRKKAEELENAAKWKEEQEKAKEAAIMAEAKSILKANTKGVTFSDATMAIMLAEIVVSVRANGISKPTAPATPTVKVEKKVVKEKPIARLFDTPKMRADMPKADTAVKQSVMEERLAKALNGKYSKDAIAAAVKETISVLAKVAEEKAVFIAGVAHRSTVGYLMEQRVIIIEQMCQRKGEYRDMLDNLLDKNEARPSKMCSELSRFICADIRSFDEQDVLDAWNSFCEYDVTIISDSRGKATGYDALSMSAALWGCYKMLEGLHSGNKK